MNRAAVFSVVSLILIGAFVLTEWLLTEWLRNASHATNVIAGAAVALALGFSIRAVHARVDRAVDTVLFRKRHENERALLRFAEDAPYVTDRDTLLLRTMQTLRRHTDAASVDILMDEGYGRYGAFDENDAAFVRMRATHCAVDLHRVETVLCGEIAFPLIARASLLGAIVLGPRQSGETYAPDETAAVTRIAQSVASALAAGLKTDPAHDAVLEGIRGLQESFESLRVSISTLAPIELPEALATRAMTRGQ